MKSGFVYIDENILPSLFAISNAEQTQGLMYQEAPTPIMTFVYNQPQINKFWMQNTPAPLDIVFAYNGKVTQIHKGIPYSTTTIGDNKFSDLIIELPQGMASSLGCKIGSEIGIV